MVAVVIIGIIALILIIGQRTVIVQLQKKNSWLSEDNRSLRRALDKRVTRTLPTDTEGNYDDTVADAIERGDIGGTD